MMTKKHTTWYEVHQIKKDGDIEWGSWFSSEGYSQYYKNDCQYRLGDAQEHIKELKVKYPDKNFVVVLCQQSKIVIE